MCSLRKPEAQSSSLMPQASILMPLTPSLTPET